MKKLLILPVLALILVHCKDDETPVVSFIADTITIDMGTSFANDIYVSLEEGIVSERPRAEWDLAFETFAQGHAILFNETKGNSLCMYPNGGIHSWETIDTAGIPMIPLHNSTESLYKGAFNANALGNLPMGGGLDVGWGVYDYADASHNIEGDSLFLIKFANGTVKKFMVSKRLGSNQDYVIKHNDVDGVSGETIVDSIKTNDYTGKNFVYYSFDDNDQLDREPLKSEWDIVFTKFYNPLAFRSVMGVLVNQEQYFESYNFAIRGILAASVSGSPVSISLDTLTFGSSYAGIGSDFWTIDHGTFQYGLADKTFYLKKGEAVYRLKFLEISTSGTQITFAILRVK